MSTPVADFVRAELTALANPDNAGPMAAYMKTDMPFHGVKGAGRKLVFRAMLREFKPTSRDDYERNVLSLWALPHREEKYAAIEYATRFRKHMVFASLPLYERMIVEGAWWDLVDGVVPRAGERLFAIDADRTAAVARGWSRSDDVWLRRSALICQLKRRSNTDAELLFELCTQLAPETIFWVRKAIGWSLREYSKWEPDAVAAYLKAHGSLLSGLSYREASRGLDKQA